MRIFIVADGIYRVQVDGGVYDFAGNIRACGGSDNKFPQAVMYVRFLKIE